MTRRIQKEFNKASLTKQSFRDECNVNTIMAKYEKTGLIDHNAKYQGRYEDVSSAPELHEALAIVQAANEAFDSLTAKVRRRFDNDPGEFLKFVQNPANLEEVRSLGLGAPSEPTPPILPVVEPPANPPAGDPPAA